MTSCRNDAGLAGAELALAVEEHTLGTGAEDTVGTTGILEVSPNAVNSVPREARLGIGKLLLASTDCLAIDVCMWSTSLLKMPVPSLQQRTTCLDANLPVCCVLTTPAGCRCCCL